MEIQITNEAFGRIGRDNIRLGEALAAARISLHPPMSPLGDYHAIPAHIAADALKGGRK